MRRQHKFPPTNFSVQPNHHATEEVFETHFCHNLNESRARNIASVSFTPSVPGHNRPTDRPACLLARPIQLFAYFASFRLGRLADCPIGHMLTHPVGHLRLPQNTPRPTLPAHGRSTVSSPADCPLDQSLSQTLSHVPGRAGSGLVDIN
ncbi:unnamed protein product [Protopolystoma xenopodis]|uniref:Uncharacterized protein n=1 Tax=Protopolystoma xenopodis TaxID=117903 RepID=A0A448X7V5_9PLAT|nr:unnamed protein product [Protopolystoma xenopodis]